MCKARVQQLKCSLAPFSILTYTQDQPTHLATEVMWHSPPPPLQQSPGQAWPSDDTGVKCSVQSLPLPGSAAYISHIDVSALTCDVPSSPRAVVLSTSGTALLGWNASRTLGISSHLVKLISVQSFHAPNHKVSLFIASPCETAYNLHSANNPVTHSQPLNSSANP